MIEFPLNTPLSEMFKRAGVDPSGPDPLNDLRLATNLSLAQIVAKLPEKDRDVILAGFESEGLAYDWNFWGRPNQIPPDKGWSTYALVSGRGFGKELCVDTPVPVPGARNGWKTMGEMKKGDKLFDERGQVCRVVEAHEVRIPEKAYRIHFSDETSIDAGKDHLWVTYDGEQYDILENRRNGRGEGTRNFPKTWAEIERQKKTDKHYRDWGYSDPDSQYYLPNWVQPARARVRDTGELFESLQAGERHYIPAVHAPIERGVFRRARPDWQGMGPKAVAAWIIDGRRKVLPDHFVYGTPNDICAMIRPILKEWGVRDPESGIVTLTIENNSRLAGQIVEMLRSLAETPTWRKGGDDEPDVILFNPRWRGLLFMYRERDDAPFVAQKGGLAPRCRQIVSIEEIEPKPMRCLTVNSKTSMYLVGEAMIPTHNTRAGAEWVHAKALQYPGCRITLVGRTAADIRDVIVDGDSGICNVGQPADRAEYLKTQRRLVWPNGSIAVGFSAEEPDQLRGWQGHFAWGDEIAAWKHTVDDSGLTAWDNMVISTRLGDTPQVLVTTTPKRNQFMFDLLEMEKTEDDVIIVRGSTLENAGALGQAYIKKMYSRYDGTRVADQELHGMMLDAVEGALWTEAGIEASRIYAEKGKEPVPALKVIAVDPSVEEDPTDDCGIIVAGATNHKRLEDREAWVLEDWSINGAPSVWAQQVVDCWKVHRCPVIVETNQGGAMAATIIHALNPDVPILDVRATEGKKLRAGPVTLKYDKGKVHHVNVLSDLEDEMCSWVPGETRKSPDRVDALVYAITALLVKPPKKLGAKQIRARNVANRRITKRKRPGEGGVAGWGR
jgi:phage terminase large subunit-like protein